MDSNTVRGLPLFEGLSDEVVAGIMHGNAQSLYRLPAAPPVGSA